MTPQQVPAPAAEQQTPVDPAALERELLAYAATWEQRTGDALIAEGRS